MTRFLNKIQYLKLITLCLVIIFAYILFQADFFNEFAKKINKYGYISIFLAGFLFAYGFAAPFAVGFLVLLAPQVNIFLAALIAGMGALLGDLIIFRFIRGGFSEEFNKLKLTFLFQKIRHLFDNLLNERFKKYLLWIIAGLLIASPLPDEIGVSFVSGFTNINQKIFSIMSVCLNTIGIFIILFLSV